MSRISIRAFTHLRLQQEPGMSSARSILSVALAALTTAACASSSSSTADTGAAPATMSAEPPSPDPRIGLRAGLMDAEEAAWNMRKVSTNPASR